MLTGPLAAGSVLPELTAVVINEPFPPELCQRGRMRIYGLACWYNGGSWDRSDLIDVSLDIVALDP